MPVRFVDRPLRPSAILCLESADDSSGIAGGSETIEDHGQALFVSNRHIEGDEDALSIGVAQELFSRPSAALRQHLGAASVAFPDPFARKEHLEGKGPLDEVEYRDPSRSDPALVGHGDGRRDPIDPTNVGSR